jgi:hypothetical protein
MGSSSYWNKSLQHVLKRMANVQNRAPVPQIL